MINSRISEIEAVKTESEEEEVLPSADTPTSNSLSPTATSWILDTGGKELIELQVVKGHKKKHKDPCANFSRRTTPVTGFRQTDDVILERGGGS